MNISSDTSRVMIPAPPGVGVGGGGGVLVGGGQGGGLTPRPPDRSHRGRSVILLPQLSGVGGQESELPSGREVFVAVGHVD